MARTKITARKAQGFTPNRDIAKADKIRDQKQMKAAHQESMKTSRAQRKRIKKK